MPVSRLVILDLEASLCAPDGRIDERDRLAIDRARASGIEVAFVTSRRASAGHERLRTLALRGWVIGSDGAEIAGADGRLITRHALPATVASRAAAMMRERDLRVIALTAHGAHGDPADTELARQVVGPIADTFTAGRPQLRELCALVGIGRSDVVADACGRLSLEAPNTIAASAFAIGGLHAVRVRPRRATRAHAIGEICARLGIGRPRTVYVGGALHPAGDASALAGAGRRYMVGPGPADDPVRLTRAAGDGAIAEALERIHPRAVAPPAS